MSQLQYIELFELIIDELTERANKDITLFSCAEYSEDYVDDYEDYQWTIGESRIREIMWFKDSDNTAPNLIIIYDLAAHTMCVANEGHPNTGEINLGAAQDNPNLKKKFIKLFCKIMEYRNTELEIKKLNEFTDTIFKKFPSIVDRLILEKPNDE
jgi:hypothetical protein